MEAPSGGGADDAGGGGAYTHRLAYDDGRVEWVRLLPGSNVLEAVSCSQPGQDAPPGPEPGSPALRGFALVQGGARGRVQGEEASTPCKRPPRALAEARAAAEAALAQLLAGDGPAQLGQPPLKKPRREAQPTCAISNEAGGAATQQAAWGAGLHPPLAVPQSDSPTAPAAAAAAARCMDAPVAQAAVDATEEACRQFGSVLPRLTGLKDSIHGAASVALEAGACAVARTCADGDARRCGALAERPPPAGATLVGKLGCTARIVRLVLDHMRQEPDEDRRINLLYLLNAILGVRELHCSPRCVHRVRARARMQFLLWFAGCSNHGHPSSPTAAPPQRWARTSRARCRLRSGGQAALPAVASTAS